MAEGQKPDWEIRALDKESGKKGLIGYGWNKPDGSISISLNPFVVVPVGGKIAIRMFSNNRPGNPPGSAPATPQARDLDLVAEPPF